MVLVLAMYCVAVAKFPVLVQVQSGKETPFRKQKKKETVLHFPAHPFRAASQLPK